MLARIRKAYLELPIRLKFQIWFMPLLIVSAGSIGFISYVTASNQVLDKIAQAQNNISSQTVSHLDYLAKDIYDIYSYLSLSSELHDLLSPEASYNSAQVVNSMINRLLSTRQFFQSLLIFSDNHPTIKFNSLNNNEIISYEAYKTSGIYLQTVAQVVKGAWGVEEGPMKLFIGDQRRKVFYSKVLVNPESLKKEGLMIIGMTEEDFRKSFGPARDNVEIIVINEDGTILSDSDGKWSGRAFTELPYYNHVPFSKVDWDKNEKQWLITHTASAATGWHVLVIQPKIEELKQLNQIRWLTIGFVVMILLINVPLSWLLSRLFSNPLMRILRSMREVQAGDFQQHVEIELRDEIGQLGKGYNTMVMRIKELIQDVYESKISQKEAELRMLQSQINPHFLYNTLNSITWMSYREGAEKTADMIQRLSEFFRFNLSQGADVITIEKELMIVENYFFLSKIRFSDKLTYSIEVEEHLRQFRVPKLLLQPLAENAVVHGIEQMEGQGFIHLSIREEGQQLIFEVTDNGMGMAPDTLERLRMAVLMEKRIGSADMEGGFALLNMRERLQNHFGKGIAIEINSRLHFGTSVKLKVDMSDAQYREE
ncbi:sensor histidine kinase [Paenibacillus sp. HWE-109]|uniref:cache domain-containing sensor histidine kinase n=1 Tax=Paenibacillus sp. HWE-109 TaxID=1306526 RepID=UPI001EDD9E72|nr:sensor histidine kinase [Paenibacillus sp. HWE-109]UKS28280.1 sensor histidine kinase [Paenibacillus sp. HWE-109]